MTGVGNWRSMPDPGGSWQQVDPMSERALTWRGRTYDLTNTTDVRALAGELDDIDDDAAADDYVEQQLLAAAVREFDADERADELQAQIDQHRATTEMLAAVNRATGMDTAQKRFEQLTRPSQSPDMLAAHRENYGDPQQRRERATADLAVPADEPQLDAQTAQIREHRRRHGI